MFGLNNKKDMVERPDDEPKFSLKNKTDRMIFLFVILGLLIVGVILALVIILYYNGIH